MVDTAVFQHLVDRGALDPDDLHAAFGEASARDVEVEEILRFEYGISRRKLLDSMSRHHGCGWFEYDERLPVPPCLLEGLDKEKLCAGLWFPVAKDGDTVVIAAHSPSDPAVREAVIETVRADRYEFRVALAEDICSFIQDFLNGTPPQLSGAERTGLANWRNIMARWRTKLAGYRTDFAKVRTNLSFLRGGLTLITITRALLDKGAPEKMAPFYWAVMATGFVCIFFGILSYLRIKRSIFRPPRHQMLVEVTSATLHFLENYQFREKRSRGPGNGMSMLARLSDSAQHTRVEIGPSLDNHTRSELAHERNLYSAQRTIAACYRTIFSRARTGLSFIRTGVSFTSIALGLIAYYGLSRLNIVDSFILIAGVALIIDGVIWYWPVRKEHYEALKCSVSF